MSKNLWWDYLVVFIASGCTLILEIVAGRIRRALELVPRERLVVAPDCGMKYLPREVALGKLQAMVRGAELVRDALAR